MPPLTDHQKKIVAEFKAKISNLPKHEAEAFIAQNKVNLIKKLNFQPLQLQILQSSGPSGAAPSCALSADQMRQTGLVPAGPLLPPEPPDPSRHLRSSLPPVIDREKKIAWVESQLRKDQAEAVKPSYLAPFRGREDACKRLLRYHVFEDGQLPGEGELARADRDFERAAETLLERYHSNLSKYHCLLLDESMRRVSSSSEAMLGRVWVAEERAALAKEKEEFRARLKRLAELDTRLSALTAEETVERARLSRAVERPALPPLPDSWAARYEEVVGKPWESHKRDRHRSASIPLVSPNIEIKKEPREAESESELERAGRGGGRDSRGEGVASLSSVLDQAQAQARPLRPDSSADLSSIDSPDPAGAFLGLKFNRTMSGRWSASLKRDALTEDEEEEEEVESKRMRDSPDPKAYSEDSEDEEFSLADVGGNNAAVQSMLENDDELEDEDDDELRFDNNSRASFDNFDSMRFNAAYPSPTFMSDSRNDNDSVQNAINSILDLPDRGLVQTPDDLKNLTGLLDSIGGEDQSAVAAAVNSIL